MTITEKVNEDIKAAMKAQERVKLDALRAVKAELTKAATEKGAGGKVSEKAEIVVKMSYALKDIFGSKHPIVFKGTPQHDDADFLTNMAGIPTLIFGPGKNSVAHVSDEYIPIDDFINATKVYAMAYYNIFS